MECNVGPGDKAIRLIIAIMLIVIGYTYSSYLGWIIWILYIFAIALVITALIGYCKLYDLIGVNTCKEKKARKEPKTKVKKKKRK